MTPDFTLSLSFQGITLLKRQDDGWATLGEVALDVPDLSASLKDLRARADAAGASDGQVMLLIPNEQIRYLDLPAPDGDDSDHADAINAALDGATPYAVEDLVVDHALADGRVHVAAVARETLDEAEQFASGHHFDPVGFAASAPDGSFARPVFFGAASGWSGPAPDAEVLSYANRVDLAPEPAKAPLPIADAPPQAPPEEPVKGAPAPTPKPEADAPEATNAPAPKVPADAPDKPDPALEDSLSAPPALPDTPETEPPVSDSDASPNPDPDPEPARIAARDLVPSPAVATPAATPAAPAFSSIRASRSAPAASAPRLGGAGQSPERASPADDAGQANPPPLSGAGLTDGSVPEAAPAARKRSKPAKGSFFSRRKPDRAEPQPPSTKRALQQPKPVRKGKGPRPAPIPAPSAASPGDQVATEGERLTVFGARGGDAAVRGKPRYLGLMLTAALLLFLAGVAAWASVFLDDGFARFFSPGKDATAIAEAPALPADALPASPLPDATAPTARSANEETGPLALAALETGDLQNDATGAPISDGDAPTALSVPAPRGVEPSPEDAAAQYAATGIWQRAPNAPNLPTEGTVDGVYTASIDPEVGQSDAVALPAATALEPDPVLEPLSSPLPADTVFDLDENGFVRARPEGSLTPEGVTVYEGKPPRTPPLRPEEAALLTEAPQKLAETQRLERLRPRGRPRDLSEQNERANLAGRSKLELSNLRPLLRPRTEQDVAADVAAPPTAQAVAAAPLPRNRPRDFERVVQSARASTAAVPQQDTRVASAAAVAPATVTPRIPTSSSVSKEATVRNVLNLRKVNLIGVYGKASSRRALVRLSNGRYQKVKVGDRIDGGRVQAIGESELRYTKRGRNVVLKMPRS